MVSLMRPWHGGNAISVLLGAPGGPRRRELGLGFFEVADARRRARRERREDNRYLLPPFTDLEVDALPLMELAGLKITAEALKKEYHFRLAPKLKFEELTEEEKTEMIEGRAAGETWSEIAAGRLGGTRSCQLLENRYVCP